MLIFFSSGSKSSRGGMKRGWEYYSFRSTSTWKYEVRKMEVCHDIPQFSFSTPPQLPTVFTLGSTSKPLFARCASSPCRGEQEYFRAVPLLLPPLGGSSKNSILCTLWIFLSCWCAVWLGLQKILKCLEHGINFFTPISCNTPGW